MRTREKPSVSSAVSQTTMISIHSEKTQYKIFAWFQSPYINQPDFFFFSSSLRDTAWEAQAVP